MINRINGHFEEKDGDKYLIITLKNGDTIQKYQEVFDTLKEIIKNINDYSQPIKYDGNYMKIKFNTDDNISLNKIIYLPTITITIRSIKKKITSPWELMDPRTKNESDKTQDICIPFDPF